MDTNHTLFSAVTLMANQDPSLDRIKVYNVCIEQPLKLISYGLWSNENLVPYKSSFTMLEMQILVIFFITQSFHFFLKRFGFPYLVSQAMAGFLLGPSIPTGPLETYKKMLFPFGSPDILNTISSFGYIFFIFLNSVQMDFTLITKTGRKVWVIALLNMFLPILLTGIFIGPFNPFWSSLLGKKEADSIMTVVISQSGCSFAVIASMLNELGILNSELGRLALSAALINDLTGNMIESIDTAFVTGITKGYFMVARNLLMFFLYLTVIPLVGCPAMRWVVRNTPEGRPVKRIYIVAIVVVLFILGYIAGTFNQPFMVGAVILGLTVPPGPPLGSELVHRMELFSTWFLSPIFVTCCTMKIDLTTCGPPILVVVVVFFIVITHMIRQAQVMAICNYCNIPARDGLCLALILSCKGIVDIFYYIIIFDETQQSPSMVAVMVLSVLVWGTISRMSVKSLYDPSRKYAGYQTRNIMNLKKISELRVVACVHKPSHMFHIKNFLQLCSPLTGNALVVDVLHLMELIGRSSPIFIAHRLQQTTGSNHIYSGELTVTFDLFERDHAGSAIANTYTAISPVTLMHEDVCHLALEKFASIIILPFHVRWAENGSIEPADNKIRSLNTKVLERAPCSIGILVDRGSLCQNLTSYKVAMVFLGGPDDREALCLAKRFANNLDNRLFVYRLISHEHDSTNWENMIDDEELREVRGAYVKLENVTYEEKTIDDASKTINYLKDVVNSKFDFIIVGRRNKLKSAQTVGLENWTEYPELGVIGDLLASSDMETKASILVVQQQQQQTTTLTASQ